MIQGDHTTYALIRGSICENVPENQVKSNIGDILENKKKAPRSGARYSQVTISIVA